MLRPATRCPVRPSVRGSHAPEEVGHRPREHVPHGGVIEDQAALLVLGRDASVSQVADLVYADVDPRASHGVLITEDLRGGDLKLGSPGMLELSFVAVDSEGKARAGSNDRLQLTALKPDTRKQIEESGLRVFNRMTLPPGRYSVRLATHDESGGALGSATCTRKSLCARLTPA